MDKVGHKCGWDCLSVNVSEIKTITVEIESELFGKEMVTREVCPCCVDHVQGESGEVLDCKNVFWDGMEKAEAYDAIPDRMVRRSVGQCMCYSEVHGKRSKRSYEL